MSYKSKLLIVNKTGSVSEYGEIIAQIDMSAIGDARFYSLFKIPVTCELYNSDGFASKFDTHGEELKYAPISTVKNWVEQEAVKNSYRRLKPLLGLLKGFDESEWDELQVVHYGY